MSASLGSPASTIARSRTVGPTRVYPRRSSAAKSSSSPARSSHAIVVEPRTERPVGVPPTLDIAGIPGWGRG